MTKDVYFLNRNYLYIMTVSKVENNDKINVVSCRSYFF
ncbi:MAG: hypothetical protein ACJAVF_003894, partial [Paraglaciecola sp.]